MRYTLLPVVLLVSIAGCGRQPPETAGGKPIEHWVQALHAPDVKDRLLAVRKLGNVGATHPAAIPALAEAVQDKSPEVRAAAIVALLPLGPQAKEALPNIEQATRDRDPKVRQCALRALEKIQDK